LQRAIIENHWELRHSLKMRPQKSPSQGRGGRRKLPWAFTEHGAIQAANVLNSPRAIAMGVYVVRAFVQLRELLSSNKDLSRRLDQLEARLDEKLATHDETIRHSLRHPTTHEPAGDQAPRHRLYRRSR
jgi:hypothetical protein